MAQDSGQRLANDSGPTTFTTPMPDAFLEVIEEVGTTRTVHVTESPFRIGRGGDGKNHLALDGARISRQSALLVFEKGEFQLQDLGQRRGLFLNGAKVEAPALVKEGDMITFGNAETISLVFRTGLKKESLSNLLSRLDQSSVAESGDRDLRQLSLLLEATALLQAHMPFEEVLGAMMDRAITITEADRGLLLEADAEGKLQPLVARRQGGFNLPPASVAPSQTAIEHALSDHRGFIERDVNLADGSLKHTESIVNQQLRAVVAIPLYSLARMQSMDSTSISSGGSLLGLLYMDSRRPAAFSGLGKQILDALAIEAASVIDNARMVKLERERRRMEQDLSIAREIQQRLLPRDLKQADFFEVTGINASCYSVGGDYFDLVSLGPKRSAFVIADVAGKGLSVALLTAMMQGGFSGITLAPDPTRLITHFNRYIWGRSEPNRYATVFMGVLDADGSCEFINAGHHSPVLLRDGVVTTPFEADCFPIGMFADAEYNAQPSRLERGDVLVMFTDGINEAVNARGDEFGMERLEEVVKDKGNGSVEDLQAAILSAVEEFSKGAPQADDMTLLILRYVGEQAE